MQIVFSYLMIFVMSQHCLRDSILSHRESMRVAPFLFSDGKTEDRFGKPRDRSFYCSLSPKQDWTCLQTCFMILIN